MNFLRQGFWKLSYYTACEWVHLVMRGQFRWRDKYGGHTIPP